MTIILTIVGILLMVISFLMATLTDKSGETIVITILMMCGLVVFFLGASSDNERETMRENNISPAVIEYITDVRNQNDETSITTADAIAVYIECKRNDFSEEEIMLFLLPDITEDEAKSIIKTYNLLEEEN